MKHKVNRSRTNKVLSFTLAAVLLASSGLTGSVNAAFASDSDDMDTIHVETSVPDTESITVEENNDISVSVAEGDGITVQKTGDGIEIQQAETKLGASVSIPDSGITMEDKRKAGNDVTLEIEAFNKLEEDVTFKLYFWDYPEQDLEQKTEQQYWKEVLTKPCMDIAVKDLDNNSSMQVELEKDGEVVQETAQLVQEVAEDQNISSRYLGLNLLAGTSTAFEVVLNREDAGHVAIVPAIETESGENWYDVACLTWEQDTIVIDEVTDIVIEKDDSVVIENPEDSIVVDQEEQVTEDNENEESEPIEADVQTEKNGPEFENTDTETDSETEAIPENQESDTVKNVEADDTDIETPEDAETEQDTDSVEVDAEQTETGDEETGYEETEEVNAEETDSETVEHFTEKTEGTEELDAAHFASSRLVVLAENPDVIIDPEHVLAQYDTIYLMQYNSPEQAMNAYVYYEDHALAVEPDAVVEMASEVLTDNDIDMNVTEEQNPVAALTEENDSPVAQKTDRVIALIDTGASEGPNVIDRVSLIDDVLEGSNSHANDMVTAIVSQNPDAKILSIRAMGNDGRGTVSSIVAAMEYAMNQNVSIINLSLYAKTNLINSVLASEIQKAVDLGIEVVGAAGNDGEDVAGYMPGSVGAAWIIGAADSDGFRIEGSNYGATVDYNVVAGSTSEAAAKFSGYISLNGTDSIVVNDGFIYTTDYVPDEDEENGDDIVTDKPERAPEYIEDSPLFDEEAIWQIGDYPEFSSTAAKTERVWVKDTEYDFMKYNPYDDNVSTECLTEIGEVSYTVGATVEASYKFTLLNTPDYYWYANITFEFIEERELITVGSDLVNRIMPDYLNQDRNEGYNGIVPGMTGETVEGKTYTVLVNTENFDLGGLLLDYNPHTFKVNHIDEGDFDITKPGSYTVIHEISYFMYYDYTWYVKNTVNVIDPATLEPGIYLTSNESTLMFHRSSDNLYGGYGDLVKVTADDAEFILSCYDDDYEVAVSSSSEEIVAEDICNVSDQTDNQKLLSIAVPEVMPTEAVILSLSRPNYEAAKLFTGGGWQVSELSEKQLNGFTDDEFAQYEDELSGESDTDEYMHIAASWSTLKKTDISAYLISGGRTCTNYGWSYYFPGTSYGTVHASDYASQITKWCQDNGFVVDKSKIKNFNVACLTGSSYMGMKVNTRYNCTLTCELQKDGSNYRLRMSVNFRPVSDSNGNYQTFGGSYTVSDVEKNAKLLIYKMFRNSTIAEATGRVESLKTVFGVYTNAGCTERETTIALSNDEPGGYKTSGTAEVPVGQKYWIKEIYRIKGTARNEEVYGPITVTNNDAGKTINVAKYLDGKGSWENLENGWIYNRPFYFRGRLLTKVDANTKGPVAGAVYRIQYSEWEDDDKGNKFKATYTWYFQTDDKGEIAYDDDHLLPTWNGKKSSDLIRRRDDKAALPLGFLRIKEMEAPSGYSLDSKVYKQEIRQISVNDYPAKTVPELTIEEESAGDKWKVRVNAKKVNQSLAGLEGAVFGVYEDEACKVPVDDITSGSDGMTNIVTVDNIPDTQDTITLYCKELTAPNGYAPTDEVFSLTFTKAKYEELKAAGDDSGELQTFGPADGIVNDQGWNVRVNAKKVKKDLSGLAGAVFGVYKDAACTDAVGEITSESDGMTDILTVGVPMDQDTITLYCKEKTAPKGYLPISEVFSLTFTKAKYDELAAGGDASGELQTFGPADGIVNEEGKLTPTPTPPPETPSGAGAYVKKTSQAVDEILGLDSYSLGGAVFEVTSSKGFSGTLTTDETGISNQLSLPDDSWWEYPDPVKDKDGNVLYTPDPILHPVTTTYYVREVTAPKGHKLYTGTKSFTVTMPYDNEKTIEVAFEDEPKFCNNNLDIEKLGVKGEPIKGAVFKVEYFDAASADESKLVKTWYLESDASGKITMDEAHVTSRSEYSSDEFFTHKGKVVLPIDGYLQLTEVAAPAEYIVDDTPIGFPTGETLEFKKRIYNDLEPCKIRLQKYATDGGTPLAGVEFELKFLEETFPPKADQSPHFQRLLKVGETIVRSTNANGEVSFDNLDQGKYQITEIKTAPGHTLLKEPIIVTIPMQMTDDEANSYGNVDYSFAKLDTGYTEKWFFYDCLYEITNTAKFTMPMSGGLGTWKYGFIGMGILAVAGTGVVLGTGRRKKRKRKA